MWNQNLFLCRYFQSHKKYYNKRTADASEKFATILSKDRIFGIWNIEYSRRSQDGTSVST